MKKSITNKITHIILALSTCVIISTAIGQGDDMFSWFRKKKEVFLSPEVNGIVTENGQPVANLEIIRSLIYIDEKVHRDTAITDENGCFHFPKKTILSSIPNKLIAEHRVSQEIFIERDNELTPLWVATQSGIDEIPEYSKKLSFLNCQMTAPHVVFEFKNQKNKHRNFVAQSICRWEEDFLPYKLLKNGKQYRINNYDLTDLTEI
ncbi:hypothetical protein BIZ38_10200 [Pseudoalteromonas sp. BZK2]|jgi:hypothetical protein|uniref:DUF6795 domain-containing protein n=1 Tax=unclassified Pseudoalteromonas TaxID=194690 RepID=UPI00110BE228|nr:MULTISPECIES: DUF6795 domain-containing protein [unclassified Pseudoalteromonas]MBC7008846.1 hypothetical protein [Pseudoalteromonas sp. BZK2]TMP13948.1 hypothetical protein CWC02_19705 [Pseudoalteromonas sp. S2721]